MPKKKNEEKKFYRIDSGLERSQIDFSGIRGKVDREVKRMKICFFSSRGFIISSLSPFYLKICLLLYWNIKC